MTMSIQERSEFSGLPPLIGAVDIAERAGVSRSRITELMDSPEFPVPAMTVRSKGRLYFESDIENYLATRNTKPGRPKKGGK